MVDGTQVTLFLSGGGNPDDNKYSQYLQGKRLNKFLRALDDNEVTTMFGSGLTPQRAQAAIPDVAFRRDA